MPSAGERVGDNDLRAYTNVVEMHLPYNSGMGGNGQAAPGDIVHRHAPALQLGPGCAVQENWSAVIESFADGCHGMQTP